ncbi:MAG: hypothetical protein V1735_00830 [Nanoarchaeota archaeon]
MKKRGQITIFIILGIVLLAAAGLFFFLRQGEERPLAFVVTEKTPGELQPVRLYVENCLDQVGKEAVNYASLHGGYTQQALLRNLNPLDYTDSGNGLPVLDGDLIPYWWYNENPNAYDTPSLTSAMPPLCRKERQDVQGDTCPTYATSSSEPSVESQLDNFVERHFEACIQDFKPLEAQGFQITEKGPLVVTSAVRDSNSVQVFASYPLEVAKAGTRTDMTQFLATFPHSLYELYGMAKEIRDWEANSCFLEWTTIEMYTTMANVKSDSYPPPFNMENRNRPLFWLLRNVKQRFTMDLFQHVHFLTVRNTAGYSHPVIDCPEGPYCGMIQAYYDNIVSSSPNLTGFHPAFVSYQFNPSWPFFFDIPQRDGQLIKPIEVSCSGPGFPASLICNLAKSFMPKIYEFDYMVSYPVLVSITNYPVSGGKDTFMFALEANMRGNKCFTQTMTQRTYESVRSEECDEQWRTDTPMTITTVNGSGAKNPVPEAEVSFLSGAGSPACTLGYTNGSGQLTTTLPQGFGVLQFEKEGYLARYADAATADGGTFELLPLIPKNFSVKIINYTDIDPIADAGAFGWRGERDSRVKDPEVNDTIVASLTRVSDDRTEAEYSTYFFIESGEAEPGAISLVPGTYTVKIDLMRHQAGHQLPEEHDRQCIPNPIGDLTCDCKKKPVDPGCSPKGDSRADYENGDCYEQGYTCEGNWLCKDCADDGDVAITLPTINLTDFPNGGVNTTWTIRDYSQLDNDQDLTLFIFRTMFPTRYHHLEELDMQNEYSNDHPLFVQPKFGD